MWLHNRSENTRRAYESDVRRFREHTGGKPLHAVTLEDVQTFASALEGAPESKARRIGVVKSLFAFGHKVGYLPFDVARPVKVPRRKNTLAERILPEADVQRMIALEPSPRNKAMLRLMYAGGLRVSELAALKWRDLQSRDDAGQLTVFGKGDRTRSVVLPQPLWNELLALRGRPDLDAPLFASQKGGGHLDPSSIVRMVRTAAERAGIKQKVSPHWLRHAHASHALDRGAPIHLVQATLGHASVATTGRYLHARPSESSASYLVV